LERLGRTQEECPSVFYLSTSVGGEWYIVRRNTPEISNEAKIYGKPTKNNANLLFYSLNESTGGWKIILYEILKYRVKHQLSAGNNALHNMAVFQAELHPKYFGTYPAPLLTPWGYTLRNKMLLNGLYFLGADQCVHTLAVSYPLWSDDLTSDTLALTKQNVYDQQEGIETTLGYVFGVSPQVGWYKTQWNIAVALCAEKGDFYIKVSTFGRPFMKVIISADPHSD